MNIDDLTIGEAKSIAKALASNETTGSENEDFGLVLCQFIGRFVFVANLSIKGKLCYLTNVRNVRYWDERPNGLGDVAVGGPVAGDKIDDWPDQIVPFDKLGPFMSANKEYWG